MQNSLHITDKEKKTRAQRKHKCAFVFKAYDVCCKYKVYVLSNIIKSEGICLKMHMLMSVLDADISKFQIVLEGS